MARTQITLRDTFNLWRTKSNEAFASLGDLGALVATKEVSFANPIYKNPDFFTGTDAQIIVTKKDVYTVSITDAGDGYSEGETLFIKGSELGGTDDVNDLTITIDSVGSNGEIGDVSTSGTPAAELILEVNQLRDEVGDVGTLTTTAQTVYGAINELDAVQGNVLATEWGTDAVTLTGAVKELKSNIGSITAEDMGTNASTVQTAIAEIAGEIGNLELLVTTEIDNTGQGTDPEGEDYNPNFGQPYAVGVNLGSDLTSAVNALKEQADDLQSELGGDMVDDYDGTQSTVIAALNSLYAASSLTTLDAEYIRRDGTVAMLTNSILKVSNAGISINTKGDALVFKTWNGDQDALVNRLTIADSTGNIGIGTDPSTSYKVNVNGKLKATNLYYGTQDTDNRYLKVAPASGAVSNVDLALNLNGNININPADSSGDLTADRTLTIHGVTIADSTAASPFNPLDWVRTSVKDFLTSSDISFNINDDGDELDLVVQNNSHTHTSSNISDFNEAVEDVVGHMLVNANTVGHGVQKGISVSYADNVASRGFLSFDVADFTVDIGRTAAERGAGTEGDVGDVVGSFTISDLGSIEDVALNVRDEKIRDVAASILTAGTGISVTSDDDNDTVTFANTDLGSSQNIFKDFAFSTQEEGSITYFNLTPTSSDGTLGARFNITRTGDTTGSSYTVEMIAVGEEYRLNETLTFDGTGLGGVSTTNDLQITVTGLNNTFVDGNDITRGEIATYSVVDPNSGAAFTSAPIGTLSAGSNADGVTYLESDGIDIAVDSTNKKVTFNVVREYVEDVVGAMFDNNFATGIDVQYYDTKTTAPTDRGKIGLTAKGLSAGDIVLKGDVTGSLSQGSTALEISTTLNTGAVGIDEIKGFDEQVRDVVKNYIDVSHTNSGLTANIVDALDEKFFAFDGDDVQDLDSSRGSGASVIITKVAQSYSVKVDDKGRGYLAGERFTIPGTELDGDNTNDLLLSVTAVDSDGGITGISETGVANVSTNTVDKYKLTVDFSPSVTIGSGDTVTVANSDISGVGTTGTAFGAKINSGAVGATELASNAVTTAKIKNGDVTRAKTSAATSLRILDSDGTALKTLYGWDS